MERIRNKDHRNENFPVASFLFPAAMKKHVIRFYRFVRAADNIADDPALDETEKLARLDHMARALAGTGGATAGGEAEALAESLRQTRLDAVHPGELLEAFRRDALNRRTESWPDLMAYCRLSAAPVGRYLIALSGGIAKDTPFTAVEVEAASDALCAALQVLNHLQDIKDDYISLRRVYLPADWLAEAGVSEQDLARCIADGRSSPALRQVIDQLLSRVDRLLGDSRPLPRGVVSRSLGREAAGIRALAYRLTEALKRRDPLAGRVEIARPFKVFWFLMGWLRG